MGKVSVAVSLDSSILECVESQGLDLGAEIEHALRLRFGQTQAGSELLRREIAEEAAWYDEHAERHGLFADRWRTF